MTVIVLGSLILTWWNYLDALNEMGEVFDARLAQSSRVLHALLSTQSNNKEFSKLQKSMIPFTWKHEDNQDLSADSDPFGHKYEGKIAFQLWLGDDTLLAHSADAAGIPLHQHQRGFHTLVHDGITWRIFRLYDPHKNWWLSVAERSDVRGELAEHIALRSVLPNLIGIPVLAILILFVVQRGLQPLETLRKGILTVSPQNLTRLKLDGLSKELLPIESAVNELLESLEKAFEREKRFTSDAAHELKTPLAVLKIHAQNAAQTNNPEQRDRALKRLVDGVDRAARLAEQLLSLARVDPVAREEDVKEIDLPELVRDEMSYLVPLALDKHQQISMLTDHLDEDALPKVKAVETGLRVLLKNLIDNAIRYTPEGGNVWVSLDYDEGEYTLAVEDSGPGISEAFKERVFERFFRTDPNVELGAGLGLAIVKRVVEHLKGQIELKKGIHKHESDRPGLRVEIRFPV